MSALRTRLSFTKLSFTTVSFAAVSIAAVSILLLCGPIPDAGAWDDPPAPPAQLVELISSKGVKKGDGWEIQFSGKAPQIPEGTLVEFTLFWRTYPLRSYELTIDGSRRFSEKLAFEDLSGFAEDVYLRAKIDFVRQSREVQEAIEKKPTLFNLEESPWRFKFYKQRFSLGTAAERESQNATVQKFFRDTLKTALSYEKSFSQKRKAAQNGTGFQKDGAFDAPSWQRFVKKEIRDPLRTLQGQIRGQGAGLRILAHQRDFGYLNEIVNAIARRSYERSRTLYDKLGMSRDPSDLSPKEIDINCKSSKSSYLLKTTERLCESQGIDISAIQ